MSSLSPSGSRCRARVIRLLAALALGLALPLIVAAPTAAAKPLTGHAGQGAQQAGTVAAPQQNAAPTGGPASGAAAAAPSSSGGGNAAGGSDSGIANAPDDTASLGGQDPSCSNPSALTAQAARNCASSGSPASAYPGGNFTPDTHINGGVSDISGNFVGMLQNLIADVFMILVKVIQAAILAVSMAFGLDLFGSDHTGRIPHALQTAESFFTLPWLPVAFALGAIWALARLWIAREEGRAIGGLAVMVAIMLGGLLIISDPQGTAGWFDSLANQAAMGTLAAFSDNNPGQPTGGYANATVGMWQETVEKPWCAMEFGNVDWCMSPLDAQTKQWRADVLAHLSDAEAPNPNPPAQQQAERQMLADAQTNGELWLAFPANDDARNGLNDNWTLYHHLDQALPDLAQIRGSGGAGERLWTLALTGIGMFFFLLLFLYIALNLLIASIFFIVLLALTPVMTLVGAFGEKGRGAFLRWLGWAAGALAAKLIYALYLGVLLLAATLVDALATGWLNAWILFAALWALAFHYRGKLLGLFTAETHHEHHPGVQAATAGLGALAMTRAVGSRMVTRPAARAVNRSRDVVQERRYLADRQADEERHRTATEQQRALSQNAEHQLGQRSEAMLDAHYDRARETLARRPELTQKIAAARADADRLRDFRLSQGGDLPVRDDERAARHRATELEGELGSAERFVQGAQEHERLTGQRYTPRQQQDARHALELELGTHPEHRDYEQLAYRLDGGRDAWRQAGGPEREQLRAQIDRQIDEDRVALASARQMPARPEPTRPQPLPPPPRRREPHRHRRYGEFLGSRQHLPPIPRRTT
jgi:hypothetical protein